MSQLVGRTFGYDRILLQVGAGGTGGVCEAGRLKPGRHVLLTVNQPEKHP